MSSYRVIAPVVVVVASDSHPLLQYGQQGRSARHIYRDALLPPGVPAETIRHLLSRQQIEEIPDGDPQGA